MTDFSARPDWLEDHRLWGLHREGEPHGAANDAFDELTRRHWAYLCRFADHPAAEDIVAEAFFREFLNRGEPPGENHNFLATMRFTVHNIRRNWHRARRFDPIPSDDRSSKLAVNPDDREVRLRDESPEFFKHLKEAAPDMPSETMRHVCLRAHDWKSSEIADILEITPAAEAQRWARTVKKWPFLRNLKESAVS